MIKLIYKQDVLTENGQYVWVPRIMRFHLISSGKVTRSVIRNFIQVRVARLVKKMLLNQK